MNSLPERIAAVLDLIEAEQRSVGEHVALPASPEALARLQKYAIGQWGIPVDPLYICLLQRNDGLDFNGTMLYAAAPEHPSSVFRFEQMNELFNSGESWKQHYQLYGETGDDLFAYNHNTNAWHILDRVSLLHFKTFESCEDLLTHILWEAWGEPLIVS